MIELQSEVRYDLRSHDFHLQEYSVNDKVKTITLLLCYDYPSTTEPDSTIQFKGVAFHHFIHTSPAIICDIGEVDPKHFYIENEKTLKNWAKRHAFTEVKIESLNTFLEDLLQRNLKVWQISSSLGFLGYVISEELQQLD